jgi:hypothetical protein
MRISAEDTHEEEGPQAGQDQRADDEVAKLAALRDPRQESTHKRRPRDPPAPIEDGPRVHPALHAAAVIWRSAEPFRSRAELLPCVCVEGDLGQVPEVAAEGRRQCIQDVPRLVHEEDAEEDEEAEAECDQGEGLDASLQPRDHTPGCQKSDYDDDVNLGLRAHLNPSKAIASDLIINVAHNGVLAAVRAPVKAHQALVDLHGTEAKRGAAPKTVQRMESISTKSPKTP